MRYIIKTLKKLNDPRQAWKIKHELADILAICIVAVMCGAQSSCEIQTFAALREEWFKGFLTLANGIPNRLTIERVLRLVNSKEFSNLFNRIMRHIQSSSKQSIVAIDGKCCYQREHGSRQKSVLYMVSACPNLLCDCN